MTQFEKLDLLLRECGGTIQTFQVLNNGISNNFLYQLADFNYLNIGGMSFWTPQIILLSAGIELFVFIFLAIHSYCRHQVA